jgi:hypothetical protein
MCASEVAREVASIGDAHLRHDVANRQRGSLYQDASARHAKVMKKRVRRHTGVGAKQPRQLRDRQFDYVRKFCDYQPAMQLVLHSFDRVLHSRIHLETPVSTRSKMDAGMLERSSILLVRSSTRANAMLTGQD